jgi:parallel beta-helix repeat protein
MKKEWLIKTLALCVVFLFIGVINIPGSGRSNFSLKEKTIDIFNNSRDIIFVDDDNTEGPWDGTTEHPYQFIQDAINNTNDGDIVYVYKGIYYEYVKIIDKNNILLIGEEANTTIIDGSKSSGVFGGINIFADYVTIEGFTIQYCGGLRGGINIWENNNCIKGNIVKNNLMGIHVLGNNNRIIGNSIIKNGEEGIVSGMYVYGIMNNIIKNNFISNQRRWYQVTFTYDKKPQKNNWFSNYWDNWIGLIPKPILGDIQVNRPKPHGDLFIPWINFDWHPARKPYNIEG